MDTLDLFQGLGLALAIGLLIGLERGWREREGAPGSRVAGIRTFALIGLLGGLWGAMSIPLGPWPLAAAGFGFAIAFALFEYREAVVRNEFSVTSTVAGLVVFALGAYAVLGNRVVAAGAGVATLTLLALRSLLHGFLQKLTWPELRSAVILLAMSFVMLPLLPDRTIDPWMAFNPHELWLLTVMIAAVSFAGYAAMRIMGTERGVLLSAIAGSLVSSTTVTINQSHLAKENDKRGTSLFAAAIVLAWITSLVRMTIIAVVVNRLMLQPLIVPILAAVAVLAVGFAMLFFRIGDREPHAEPDFQNPLDLPFVLRFGALLGVILVAAQILRMQFGETGVFALAGVSGFADVDPITLSSAKLAGSQLTPRAAAESILLAAGANMITKIVVPISVAGVRFGLKLAAAGVLAIAAAGVALLLTGS